VAFLISDCKNRFFRHLTAKLSKKSRREKYPLAKDQIWLRSKHRVWFSWLRRWNLWQMLFFWYPSPDGDLLLLLLFAFNRDFKTLLSCSDPKILLLRILFSCTAISNCWIRKSRFSIFLNNSTLSFVWSRPVRFDQKWRS